MKRSKLKLSRETIRHLDDARLAGVHGGVEGTSIGCLPQTRREVCSAQLRCSNLCPATRNGDTDCIIDVLSLACVRGM